MTSDPTILGYFSWEGDPVRLIDPEDGYNDQAAEIYVAGKGFTRVRLTDVMPDAIPVSHATFDAMVAEADRLRGLA